MRCGLPIRGRWCRTVLRGGEGAARCDEGLVGGGASGRGVPRRVWCIGRGSPACRAIGPASAASRHMGEGWGRDGSLVRGGWQQRGAVGCGADDGVCPSIGRRRRAILSGLSGGGAKTRRRHTGALRAMGHRGSTPRNFRSELFGSRWTRATTRTPGLARCGGSVSSVAAA